MRRRRRRLKRPPRRRKKLKKMCPSLLEPLPQHLLRPRLSPSPLLQSKNLHQMTGMTMTKISPQWLVPTAGSASKTRLPQLPLTLLRDSDALLRAVATISGVPTRPKQKTRSMIHRFPSVSLTDPLRNLIPPTTQPLQIRWGKHK